MNEKAGLLATTSPPPPTLLPAACLPRGHCPASSFLSCTAQHSSTNEVASAGGALTGDPGNQTTASSPAMWHGTWGQHPTPCGGSATRVCFSSKEFSDPDMVATGESFHRERGMRLEAASSAGYPHTGQGRGLGAGCLSGTYIGTMKTQNFT